MLYNSNDGCVAMTVSSSINGSYAYTSMLDPSSQRIVGNITGVPGGSPVLDPKDGLIFASKSNGMTSNGAVYVYNATTFKLIKQITVGINPSQPVYDPDNGMVYIGTYGLSNLGPKQIQPVQIISPRILGLAGDIPTGFYIHYLAYNPANHLLYAGDDGSLCNFCTTSNTTIINATSNKAIGVLKNLFGEMTYSPISQEVYVLNYSETGPVQRLVGISTTNEIKTTLTLSKNPTVSFSNMILNPDNGLLFISNSTTAKNGSVTSSGMTVVNTSSDKISKAFLLPGSSLFLASCYADGSIFISADTSPGTGDLANGAVFAYYAGDSSD
jgi:hypothetical protein